MADYNSSLPIRTEANADVVATLCDATTTTQKLAITANGNIGNVIHDATTNSSTLAINTAGRLGGVIHDGTTDSQVLGITASGSAKIDINEQTLTAVKVSANSTANSAVNPIYVSFTESVSSGEVCDYDTQSGAPNVVKTHTYTVTAAKTLLLRQIIASSSGKMKVEIQTDQGATPTATTIAVGFTSTSDNNLNYTFAKPIEVGATLNVTVLKTNLDKATTDLYSTIIGEEV